LEYCHKVRYRKTRITCLPIGEKILKTYLFISTEYMNVTDRQTDKHCTTALCGKNK